MFEKKQDRCFYKKYFIMEIAIKILAFLTAYIGMEGVAWGTHKYLMHGPLWFLHEDHHTKNPNRFLEKNDWFFVLFALPGIALIVAGINAGWNASFFAGLGISAYGFTYFLVHEILIHQRLPLWRKTDNLYLAAVRRAHRRHHIHKQKEDGECFGMLFVSKKFFDEERVRLEKEGKLTPKNINK